MESKKYIIDRYQDIFNELFLKQNWTEETNNMNKVNFSYTSDKNIKSDLYQSNSDLFNSFSLDKPLIDLTIVVYFLIINNTLYFYKEGKVFNEQKILFFTEQNYYDEVSQKIKYICNNKFKSILNKVNPNTYKIFTVSFNLKKDDIELIKIQFDPNLGLQIDKQHRTKIHYWIWFDLLHKFVFKNTQRNRWNIVDSNIKNIKLEEMCLEQQLLKIYTNKNSSVFKKASQKASKYIHKGCYGFIYDDFNPDMNLKRNWEKKYKNIKVFNIAPMKKTVEMDAKISFTKRMNDSDFTPEGFLSIEEVSDKNALYFLKQNGGTGSKGVNIYTYEKLIQQNINNRIIQKNISNPDLYDNKRYKIRQLVLVHKKKIYAHKDSWFTRSNINYCNSTYENLRDMHIIYQHPGIIFELTSALDNFELIFSNIKRSLVAFQKYYSKEIKSLLDNEFMILGFDYIVDNNKNVQIIEINHRSNYAHPKNVSEKCDVGFMKDTMFLLIHGQIENTHFELINNEEYTLC